jgi:hypothetical protein
LDWCMKIGGKEIKVSGKLVRVARLDGDKFEFPADPEAVLAGLRRCGSRVDLFTFMQKLTDSSPRYPYPMEMDNLAVVPVSTFDNWWNKQIRSYPRNRARQAQKRGVVLREVPFGEPLLQGIRGIYNEVPVRQGKRFPHYGMTLERAHQYAGTFLDRSIFIGAFLGDTMIGFGKLVTDESRTQACLIHILSMVQHRDKAPTNALIAQAVRSCADRGIPYLVYEHFTYGKKQGDTLSHFKEVNGFQRMEVPRYYVPLTGIGSVAFRLGLHRRLVDHIPESLASALRTFRTVFYSRKFKTVMEG